MAGVGAVAELQAIQVLVPTAPPFLPPPSQPTPSRWVTSLVSGVLSLCQTF